MVNDFEPGMTVITLPIHKFEFFRKSDLIYFKQISSDICELYEIRGTIIHKTVFRARGELYPHFTDMIQDSGSNFVQVFADSLSADRAEQAHRLANTIQTRIDHRVRIHSRKNTESILDLCPHGFVFRDWVADFLHPLTVATQQNYRGFFFFEDGVEEQSNLSRFLQYVVQRATGGDGNNQQQAEGGLTPEQIQGLLERIVAASEEEEATTTTTTNMELNEDDVEEVVEE